MVGLRSGAKGAGVRVLGWMLCGCMMHGAVHAADAVPLQAAIKLNTDPKADSLTAARDRRLGRAAPRAELGGRAQPGPVGESRFARAISQAAAKGIVESSVEGYTEVLIQCQKATSPASTTALMRSNAQQDHCYRF